MARVHKTATKLRLFADTHIIFTIKFSKLRPRVPVPVRRCLNKRLEKVKFSLGTERQDATKIPMNFHTFLFHN